MEIRETAKCYFLCVAGQLLIFTYVFQFTFFNEYKLVTFSHVNFVKWVLILSMLQTLCFLGHTYVQVCCI